MDKYDEIIKAKKDPVYFMEHFLKIKLLDYQKELLRKMIHSDVTIIPISKMLR